MTQILNYRQFLEFAMEHYNHGGDAVVECWDELSYDMYVYEFGPMTRKKALDLFRMYEGTAF